MRTKRQTEPWRVKRGWETRAPGDRRHGAQDGGGNVWQTASADSVLPPPWVPGPVLGHGNKSNEALFLWSVLRVYNIQKGLAHPQPSTR